MENFNSTINQYLADVKKKTEAQRLEWLSDEYKNGTGGQQLLHECAILMTEHDTNQEESRLAATTKKRKLELAKRNFAILSRCTEISREYSIQMDIEEGLIFK